MRKFIWLCLSCQGVSQGEVADSSAPVVSVSMLTAQSAGTSSSAVEGASPPQRGGETYLASQDVFADVQPLLSRGVLSREFSVQYWSVYGLGLRCALASNVSRETFLGVPIQLVSSLESMRVTRDGPIPIQLQTVFEWALGRCGGIREVSYLLKHSGTSPIDESVATAIGSIFQRMDSVPAELTLQLLRKTSTAQTPWGLYSLSKLKGPIIDELRQFALKFRDSPDPIGAWSHAILTKGDNLQQATWDQFANEKAPERQLQLLRSINKAPHEIFKQNLPTWIRTHKLLKSTDIRHWISVDTHTLHEAADYLALHLDPERTSELLTSIKILRETARTIADLAVQRRIARLLCTLATSAKRHEAKVSIHTCASAFPSYAGANSWKLRAIQKSAQFTDWSMASQRLAPMLADKSAAIQERTLIALINHPEARELEPTLVRSLTSSIPGVVKVAADTLGKNPRLTQQHGDNHRTISPKLEQALRKAIEVPWDESDGEVQRSLLKAIEILKINSVKSIVEKYCNSSLSSVHAQASETLKALTPAATCGARKITKREHSNRSPTVHRFELETSVGKLELHIDSTHAPNAAAHFTKLLRNGWFNKQVFHRVVPGFIVQTGSPRHDGYGGMGRVIPCETNLVSFKKYNVGVAISARDEGSSQFFVTLQDSPQLDGLYTWIGTASGPWELLSEEDEVLSIKEI